MRFIGRVLGMAVLVLAVIWLGLWWWAQGRMQTGFANWATRMQAQGDVKISYARISRGLSPLAAKLTLTNVLITVQPDPRRAPISLTLPSLGMEIDAANPRELRYNLPQQVSINTPRADIAVTFGSIALTQQIDLSALAAAEIDPFNASDASASNINIMASSGSLLLLHIDNYGAHASFNRKAGAGDRAIGLTETIKGISLSPLLTRLASVPFGGAITQIGLKLNISGPAPAHWEALASQFNAIPVAEEAGRGKVALQAVQSWASQGGNANASLSLAIGPTTLNASGAVKFDSQVQPAGTADISADHLDAFSAAITGAYPQMQNTISMIQARLSPYLSATPAAGQALNMHVVYGAGRVSINGQKVADIPPIDWNTLEHPPAPTPQAPGDGSGAAAQPPVVSGAQ